MNTLKPTPVSAGALQAPPARNASLRPGSPLAAFNGEIVPHRTSPLYLTGLALVAFAMVLLPVIYVGLIGLAGYGTYYHATHHTSILYWHGFRFAKALVYATPIVAGTTLVIFMLKPLFAKQVRQAVAYSLDPRQEPLLFSLIERICTLVGAPIPRRVDLNCQVNAAASFRRGLLSLVRNDLVLTIGLPLAAGLNMRQFAGVLAHEFGHFAQGAGMRLSYLIRQINCWFARVVYERDQWDVQLDQAANATDWRTGVVLQVARGAVWLTRRILWVLMQAGHAASCFMLRQMEYDADGYACQVAGSDAFVDTTMRLHTLNLAARTVSDDLQESWKSERLPDDVPALTHRKAALFSPELQQQIQTTVTKRKTGLFDTHPADADRIQAAQTLNAAGLFEMTEPATQLFENFPQLSRQLTRYFYENELGLSIGNQNLISTEESLKDSLANAARQESVQRYFVGVNTMFCPVILDPEKILPLPDWKASVQNLQASREYMREHSQSAQKAFTNHTQQDIRSINCSVAMWLLQSGFEIRAGEFGLAKATEKAAQQDWALARAEMERTASELGTFAQHATQRLAAAFQLLQEPGVCARIEGSASLYQEANRLVQALAKLAGIWSPLHHARRQLPALVRLVQNRQNHKQPAKVDRQVIRLAGELKGLLQQIQVATAQISYPFQHARGTVSIAEYARTGQRYANEVQAIFFEGQAQVDRLFALYHRILGCLVSTAERVEAQIERGDFEINGRANLSGGVEFKQPRHSPSSGARQRAFKLSTG